MAVAGQQIDELFISLGLDIAQLQLDFDTAEQTVSGAIAQLNRESNNIKIQLGTDLSKLDGVGSELDKIKVKQEAINHQLDLQRQKEAILAAVLKDAQKNTGVDSGASRKAETDLLRQQKLIAETEAAWRKLEQAKNAAQGSKTTNADTKTSQLSLGGLISTFNDLKAAASSSDGALTKTLGIIENIPHPAGKAVAALVALPIALKKVEDSLLEFAKPAITAGDAFYVMSRGMQMSIKDAAQLSMICKVTGIDINEVNSALRRFSTQVNKAGSDSAMLKMLERYGAEVRDSSGRIKNEIELASELGAALKRAQAEGNGAAFRDIVGGKFWRGDFVTFLEDFADNVEQAKKVVKNGLADPARAHAIQGELNTLEAQAGQLNSAFSSAFMPIAEKIVPHATQRLGELTKVIAENADAIKTVGSAVADVVNAVEDVAATGTKAVVSAAGALTDALKKPKKDLIQRYLNDDEVNSVEDLTKKELQRRPYTERISIENNSALYEQTLAYYQPMYQGIVDAREKISKESKKVDETLQELTYESFHQLRAGYDTQAKQVIPNFVDPESLRKAREETQKLSDELFKLTHSDYENQKLDVYNWQSKLLKDEKTTAEQREIIEKITAEKISQIEQEKEEKISQIRQSASAQFQNDLQNRIAQIEKEKNSWIKAGMEEAEATQLAEQQKTQAIKNLENEVAAEIRSIWGTELENRLAQIDTERQAWIKKGIDETYATQLAEAEKAKVIQDFNNNTLSNLYSSWQNELEKRMSQINREKEAWQKKGVDEATATAWAENEKAKAMKNFENEVAANINSIWQTELQNRLDQIDREVQAWKQKGLDEVKATEWAEQAKADARKNAAMSVLKSQLEEYRAYREGGFQGLREYQLGQLYKAGITDEDLKMTAYQLESFQSAKKLSESSLLPNLMSYDDYKSYQNMIKPDYSGITITSSPQSGETRIWPDNAQDISSLNPEMSALNTNLADLNSKFADVNTNSQAWTDLSQKLSDLNVTLTNFSKQQPVLYAADGGKQNTQQQPQTISPNISVNIQEAHAWDSAHIQELADKVADKIAPEIESALNSSNSY